ncbi:MULTISPECIES: ubiquinone biosynthesis accessory factor UbiJ [Methylococcus]|uniref:Ubiquinone biosynthesis accessory factor UbiJ n=1 Tax=Methylococcus capsulatus TaxID=414 RepID=A0ABZ2F438_METCP|nr:MULTISPECIES: SCP2 sterol-binding domain-containing protein [Methylococcus]
MLKLLMAAALRGAMEKALSRHIALGTSSRARLEALAGKTLALVLTPPGVGVLFCPTPDGIQVLQESTDMPDAVIAGSPFTLARLALSRDRISPGTAGPLVLEGDTETARQFSALLQDLDIPWEAMFARYLGPTAARSITDAGQAFRDWSADLATTLRLDIRELLQEETRIVPAGPEADALYTAVDHLRDGIARLEAKLGRIEKTLPAAPGKLQPNTP